MDEKGYYQKRWYKGLIPIDILFPNKQFGGVYHLGICILYDLIMRDVRFTAKKVYSDSGKLTSKLIGISISYERDFKRIPKLLKENNIKITKGREQIIFCGGTAVMLNPKAIEPIADFIALGDIEAIMPEVLAKYREQGKEQFLEEIKNIEGVYIPGRKKTVKEIEDLDLAPYPLYQPLPENMNNKFVFGETFVLEIERSCPYNCSFCVIPAINKKNKIRSLESIKKIIDAGIKINKREHVTIYSPAFTHPKRKEILRYLLEKGLRFSLPSIRAEVIDEELLELIKKGGEKSITIAPESTESLRKSLGKAVPNKVYENIITLAKNHGLKVKLYVLIGTPGMSDLDVEELCKWLNQQKCYVSINPLVPKKLTELSNYKFDMEKIKKQAEIVKKNLKVKYKIANINNSYEEYIAGI